MFKKLNALKKFNYENIYLSDRTVVCNQYFELIINTIYNLLKESFKNREKAITICHELVEDFEDWLSNYWNKQRDEKNKNSVIFDLENEKEFCRAIIYYIAGMTDNYAIDTYNKIIRF